MEENKSIEELVELVKEIVEYFVENNAEHDAIDLLMEVDKLSHIKRVRSSLV